MSPFARVQQSALTRLLPGTLYVPIAITATVGPPCIVTGPGSHSIDFAWEEVQVLIG